VAPTSAFSLYDSPYLDILKIVAAVAWLFLGIAGYFAFTFFFVAPLRRVVYAMEHASSREGRPFLAPEGAPEFQAIARAFNGMVKKQQRNQDKIRYQLEELQRTHRELGTARASLVRSEQLAQVGVLAAGVAHEVGNPLGLVAGYVEMLSQGDISEDQRQLYLGRIDAALDRIQRVLRNLLDFSRLDEEDEEAMASVKLVLGGVVDLVKPQARFREKTIHSDLEDGLPRVCIHPGRLEQILLNLVMNAADATQPGGVIWVRAHLRGKVVVVRVEDDGPGIPEADLERVFHPFVTSKEKGTGTGLGLFVCQHLITAYGGDVRASNLEGGGASFEFSLWVEE
jgi:signal transduction histidine kinase